MFNCFDINDDFLFPSSFSRVGSRKTIDLFLACRLKGHEELLRRITACRYAVSFSFSSSCFHPITRVLSDRSHSFFSNIIIIIIIIATATTTAVIVIVISQMRHGDKIKDFIVYTWAFFLIKYERIYSFQLS
jgi:hypothetical protein